MWVNDKNESNTDKTEKKNVILAFKFAVYVFSHFFKKINETSKKKKLTEFEPNNFFLINVNY